MLVTGVAAFFRWDAGGADEGRGGAADIVATGEGLNNTLPVPLLLRVPQQKDKFQLLIVYTTAIYIYQIIWLPRVTLNGTCNTVG